ncbi:nickel-dependent hydrogenase large subunit [Terasakiella sp. SH-1]|uniref:nickel-dependent hydrogenase large subunit n=1 Tax=Terasakiella sp. SH-1 TaxID=2560057 RepID=UPI0010743BC5|nr:nickel-dependent hydrogenase large subunit [Terasakiella sp. SH-1]
MMDTHILIDIHPSSKQDQPHDVRLQTKLPAQLASGFKGLNIEDVTKRIPLIFSICGAAQGYCAVDAAEHLLQKNNPERSQARSLIVLAEQAKEYILRNLMEWAELGSDQAALKSFAPVTQWRKQFANATFAQTAPFHLDALLHFNSEKVKQEIEAVETYLHKHVFNQPTEEWVKMTTCEDFFQWMERSKTIPAQLVKLLLRKKTATLGQTQISPLNGVASDVIYHKIFDDTDFPNKPKLDQKTAETGALARQINHPLITALAQEFGNGVLTRYVARLIELAHIPSRMRKQERLCQTTQISNDSAISTLETARGRLYHALCLEGEAVTDYQILSPSQWNFHPSSIAVESLQKLAYTDEQTIKKQAEMIIRAIDPCVGFEVRVH